MSKRTGISILAVILVGAIAGFGGYLLGHGEASTKNDAKTGNREAFRVAFKSSFPDALESGENRGRKIGLKRGQREGEKQGTERGRSIGSDDVAEEQARLAAEAAAAAEATAAQAEVLPPIPDGADEPNPTELCESAPTTAAAAGYYCP